MYASSKDRDKSIALSLSLSPSSTSSKPGRKCDGRSIKETSSEEVILSSPISAASSTSGLKRRSEDLKLDLDETQNQTPKRQRPRASPNKAPVKTAPSPSTPRFLNSVTDDMIRNPENYEGVRFLSKSWEIIRPFFIKYKIPADYNCRTIRAHVASLCISELEMIVDGISNPFKHLPYDRMLEIKTYNKTAALKCFTRIIHGHRGLTQLTGCKDDPICINLMHWSSTSLAETDIDNTCEANPSAFTHFFELDNEVLNNADSKNDEAPAEKGKQNQEIISEKLESVTIDGYSFKQQYYCNNTIQFSCMACLSILYFFTKYSPTESNATDVPPVARIFYDVTTKKFLGNSMGSDGEMHACENPKYLNRVPVVTENNVDPMIPGKDSPFEVEHAVVLSKIISLIPLDENDFGGILYFITRLIVLNGEYVVTSEEGYIGWTSVDETNEQPLRKRFLTHVKDEKREEKISGYGELYMIQCFIGTATQAEHLEFLCLKNKSFLKPAGTILTNIGPPRCYRKDIRVLCSPSNEFHATLLTGINQMIVHGIKYGAKLPVSCIS